MSAVEFVPDGPELSAPGRIVDWVAGVEGAATPDPGALADSGVLQDGRLHPRLEALRAAIAGAHMQVFLERADRRGRGWLGPSGAALAYPLPDGRVRLLALPAALFVDALVRLNDVGPRPRVVPAVRIVAQPGELASAIGARDPSGLRLLDGDEKRAFAALVEGLREHWRVAVRWDPAEGALDGRELEVLDTEGGYWLVVPADPTVELWPTTPREVFRGLCDLFPLTAELRR